MNNALSSKFQLLRVRIESNVRLSSVILVTSALPRDGKSLLSYGLAEALAAVGHRTALVDTAAIGTENDVRSSDRMSRSIPVLSLAVNDSSPAASRDAINTAVDQLRGEYDYTIIDAPPLTTSGTSMLLAGAVDAVLVAVRHGRTPCDADQIMVHTLRALKAKVLGVIASDAASIAEFEKRRERHDGGRSRFAVVEPRIDDVTTPALFAQ
jgi:succinoglycan biosynthesis transport protein ExoP